MITDLAQAGAQIAGVAAGVAGAGYLARKGWVGGKYLARASKAVTRLARLGDEDVWPNGSTDLASFLGRIYSWLEAIDSNLVDHLADHKQAEIDQARGTRRWDPPEGTAI